MFIKFESVAAVVAKLIMGCRTLLNSANQSIIPCYVCFWGKLLAFAYCYFYVYPI